MRTSTTSRRTRIAGVALLSLALAATACLPASTASGRPGPIRKVAVIGDSLTWGLFGTTPTVEGPLRSKLAASGISLTLDGGSGDTLDEPWPGRTRWADLLQARIDRDDPDVVIIQSVLYPKATDPANHAVYRQAVTRLLDIAQSRGAHVYLVRHHPPTNPTEFNAAIVAEQLQTEAAAGRGVPTIPMNWWMERCASAYVFDGFHLSAKGEECWANAVNAAVNQLRNEYG